MSDDLDPRRAESLREVEVEAQRAARDAREFREENERGLHRGEETDYPFRLPPDVVHADHVRIGDDVELADRQERMADAQRRAAETLRQNAERLERTARDLDRAEEAVLGNRDELRDIQQNTEALRTQVSEAGEQVESTRVPSVDEGETGPDGEHGRG